jgi:hypothetical protein
VPQIPPRRKDRVQTPEQSCPGILVFVQVSVFCCNPLPLGVSTLPEVYGNLTAPNIMPEKPKPVSELVLYQTEDGSTRLEVRLENETVWLTQNQMAELFQTSIPNVSMHIRNLFKERELQPDSVVKEFLTTAADGKDYHTRFYNLDVIISVGYRVKSLRGTQFRIWATQCPPPFLHIKAARTSSENINIDVDSP